jgi:hypothetical protein
MASVQHVCENRQLSNHVLVNALFPWPYNNRERDSVICSLSYATVDDQDDVPTGFYLFNTAVGFDLPTSPPVF